MEVTMRSELGAGLKKLSLDGKLRKQIVANALNKVQDVLKDKLRTGQGLKTQLRKGK